MSGLATQRAERVGAYIVGVGVGIMFGVSLVEYDTAQRVRRIMDLIDRARAQDAECAETDHAE